jgi:hypothetical protein
MTSAGVTREAAGTPFRRKPHLIYPKYFRQVRNTAKSNNTTYNFNHFGELKAP